MQLYRPRHKTAHRSLQGLFLRLCPLNLRKYQTDTSSYNTACATLERITAPQHLQHIPDTRHHAGRCAAQHRPPIIIMYIRGCSIPQTMPARRGQLLPCVDRWQVPHPAYLLRGQRLHLYRVNPAACDLAPGQPVALHPAGQSSSRGAAGGAEPLTATAAFLFGLSPDSQ